MSIWVCTYYSAHLSVPLSTYFLMKHIRIVSSHMVQWDLKLHRILLDDDYYTCIAQYTRESQNLIRFLINMFDRRSGIKLIVNWTELLFKRANDPALSAHPMINWAIYMQINKITIRVFTYHGTPIAWGISGPWRTDHSTVTILAIFD